MGMRQWIAVFGSIIGAFMAVLDIQITSSSVLEITGGLAGTLDQGSWISTAYLIGEIIIIPLSGYLARVFSLRTYLMATSCLFLLFSFCCGLSWNMESLIVFRVLQGVTGGALIPLAFQVMLLLPPDKRNVGMTLFAVTATFAPAIGPTIGGYITDTFHWQALFYINLVPGIFLLFAVSYGLDREVKRLDLLKNIDKWGVITMAIGLSCLTVFLEEGQTKDWFGSTLICYLFVIAVISLSAFLYIELKSKNPFINLRLLKNRNFGLGSLVNFVGGMAMYGALYLLPQYLASVQRYDAAHIGQTMIWAGIPQLFILPFLPLMMARFDTRWMAFTGLNLFGLSCIMNSHLTSLVGFDQLIWSQIVRSIGQSIFMVPLITITTGTIQPEQAGSASGLFNMLRNLGGSVGIAILSTMVSMREQFHSAKIGEGVSILNIETQQRLLSYGELFLTKGYDLVTSAQKATGLLDAAVRIQANVMAFNDCFLFVASALILSSLLLLLCKKVSKKAGAAGAH